MNYFKKFDKSFRIYYGEVRHNFIVVKKEIDIYWSSFGRWRKFLTSPYLISSLFINIACFNLWSKDWWDIPLGALPDILGFTLGGFAITLSFGSERFLMALSGDDEAGNKSPLSKITIGFFHFVVIQILCYIFSLVSSSFRFDGFIGVIFGFFGVWFFIYAITCGLAAGIAVFRMARWYEMALSRMNERENKRPPPTGK